jgi:hypothetical protein
MWEFRGVFGAAETHGMASQFAKKTSVLGSFSAFVGV